MIDFNRTIITGKVFDMGLSPTKNPGIYVAEGKICVNNSKNAKGDVFKDDFFIRCYGKQAEFLGKLADGTRVILEGKLKEDIRVNADNPNTVRSKVYINVDNYEVVKGDKNE